MKVGADTKSQLRWLFSHLKLNSESVLYCISEKKSCFRLMKLII